MSHLRLCAGWTQRATNCRACFQACELEGAFVSCQTLRDADAKRARSGRDDDQRLPTRPRLSPDPDSTPASDMMEEEDLWCVASVLRCERGGRFTLTLARRSVARDGLQVLLRSHRLQTEHSGTVAAYRMAMAGELSTALSSEAVATNDAERLAESVSSTRKLHASTAGIDTCVLATGATAAAAGGLRLAAGAIPFDERSASAVVDTGWLTKSLHCKHYSARLGAASASSKAMFAAAGVASCLLRAESCSAFAVLGVIRAALAIAAMLADSDAFSSTASASC